VTDRPRVVIADAQATIRSAVRRLLERSGFAVCAEASSAAEAIELARRERPELLTIDILCDGGALTVAKACAASPGTAVVVLTRSRDPVHLFESVRAGASGYLLKDMDPDRLPLALRGVLAGEATVPRSLVASLVGELHAPSSGHVVMGRGGCAELTRREWEVGRLLADRLSTKDIAERLVLSPVTVRRHTSSIRTKLAVADRESAIALLAGGEPPG
jgi:DNA-binding NarL/FixJ family response regulator